MRLPFPVAQAASDSTSAVIIRIRFELLMISSSIVRLADESVCLVLRAGLPGTLALRPRSLVGFPSTRKGADPRGGPAPFGVRPGCYAPGGTMIVSSCRAGVDGGSRKSSRLRFCIPSETLLLLLRRAAASAPIIEPTSPRKAPPAAAPVVFAAVSVASAARSRSAWVGPLFRRTLVSRSALACARGPEATVAALCAAVRAAPSASIAPTNNESAQQSAPCSRASLRRRSPAIRTARYAPRKELTRRATTPKTPEPAPRPLAGLAEYGSNFAKPIAAPTRPINENTAHPSAVPATTALQLMRRPRS